MESITHKAGRMAFSALIDAALNRAGKDWEGVM